MGRDWQEKGRFRTNAVSPGEGKGRDGTNANWRAESVAAELGQEGSPGHRGVRCVISLTSVFIQVFLSI